VRVISIENLQKQLLTKQRLEEEKRQKNEVVPSIDIRQVKNSQSKPMEEVESADELSDLTESFRASIRDDHMMR